MTADTTATTTTATRGRKPKALLLHAHPEVDQAKIDNAMTVMRDIAQGAQELAVQIGYDGALTVGALEDGIRFYQRRTVDDLMQLGMRLLLLKEMTPHGEFIERLNLLNIDHRLAQRVMGATLKFSNAGALPLLEAAGSQTKLLELAVLDDEELHGLGEGETVRGIDLDDIERMSSRELRAALRETRGELVSQKQLTAVKNERIDELHGKLHRFEKAPPDDALAELRREVTAAGHDAEGAIVGHLRQGLLALREHHDKHGGESDLMMAGQIGQLISRLIAIREELVLPEIGPEGVPEWVSAE